MTKYQIAARVSEQIVAAIDLPSLQIPRRHKVEMYLKGVGTRARITSMNDLNDLAFALPALAMYGWSDRLIQVGVALLEVPPKLVGVYYPAIVSSLCTASVFAMRSGQEQTAVVLREYAFELVREAEPRRIAPDTDGRTLEDVPSLPADEQGREAAGALSDVEVLCGMEIFGDGKRPWTKRKIARTIDANFDWLRSQPGWEPWS